MAGFLQRLVQRGLGRARTAQPLHPASFARDAARAAVRPAALPGNFGDSRQRSAGIYRLGEASEDPEQKEPDEMSRAAAPEGDEEKNTASPGSAKLSRATEGDSAPKQDADEEEDEDAPLVQTKSTRIQRRRLPPVIFRAGDDEAEDTGDDVSDDAGAGEASAPGDSDEGIAADAGAQADVPEDEDLAPGKGNDILSPKLYRSVSRHRRAAPQRSLRIYRASEAGERDDESLIAPSVEEDDSAPRDDDQVSAARIQRRAAGPGPAAMNAPSTRGAPPTTPRRGGVEGPGAVEFLMPPTTAAGSRDALTFSEPDLSGRSEPGDSETRGTSPADRRESTTLQFGASGGYRQDGGRYPAGESRRAPAAAPEIQISIGRIEIRAISDAPAAQPTGSGEHSSASKMQSLQDYLKRRNGEIL